MITLSQPHLVGGGLIPNRDVVHCLNIIFSYRSASMNGNGILSLWHTNGIVITILRLLPPSEVGVVIW